MMEKLKIAFLLFCIGLAVNAQVFMLMGVSFPTTLTPASLYSPYICF